eukprot:TRINITY_DN74230_c0_g1_i1.p1 TRINITY_DN74230_c0_g1~~TRINITY_DN74230_c0_g1_i1.p1  ORF type:complete len:341 (+),score=39.60 TRINITY_DN74230_c0_g1_i1:49-1023(+)
MVAELSVGTDVNALVQVTAPSFGTGCSFANNTDTLRVCTYNVFEGFASQAVERVGQFKAWVRTRNLDIIGLNEANTLSQEALAHIGGDCGFPHSHLMESRTQFHLGILSKHPFEIVDTSALKLHHGLLHAQFKLRSGGVGSRFHVLITHLTPFETSRRHDEVNVITDYARNLGKELLVLMGDLNSLSPLDRELHQHARLREETLLHVPKLHRKFLDPEGQVDYEPIGMLYRAGFIDVGQESTTEDASESTTVPTSVNVDDAHAAAMRLDYILVGSQLAKLLRELRVSTVRDEATDRISDHFPVICTMKICSEEKGSFLEQTLLN